MFLTDLKFNKVVALCSIALHTKVYNEQMSNIVCQQYQNMIIRDIKFEKMISYKDGYGCS